MLHGLHTSLILTKHLKGYDTAPSIAIGFKLMYDQIPSQFIKDSKFDSYLQDNNIAIIHLVREAKILRAASKYDGAQEKKLLGGRVAHTTDTSVINSIPTHAKMPWNQRSIQKILDWEEESNQWHKYIHSMDSVRDFYLSYENLLSKEGLRNYLSQVASFLLPSWYDLSDPHKKDININSSFLQLHSSSCSDRVENYSKLAQEKKLEGSHTIAACNMIEEMIFKNKMLD